MGQGKGVQKRKEDSLGRLVLGRHGYRCGRLLGKGAFSGVYYVEGQTGGNACVCKISGNISVLEREAQVMALLEHPLFPKYFGFWQEAGLGFLLGEYIPGYTLEEMLMRRGHFTAEQTIRVGMALAEGLRYLHERPERFLFRDVKPANIMIRQDGSVMLIDFGCVCSMEGRISSRAGTPDFAAPEQLEKNGRLLPACDVYGVGRTLKAMLGPEREPIAKKPFIEGRKSIATRHYVRELAGRRKRKRLDRILDACTRTEAARRIPAMAQVGHALGRLST